MTGADMGSGVFTNTNLSNANLTNINLTNVNLRGSTFSGTTTVAGVMWSNTVCPDGTNSNAHSTTCVGHGI
jgi:uncharacterized protein YjbI with pentapeptide repeats